MPYYDCLEKKGASNPVESGKGNHQLNPNYITGFVDGEGCFHITIAKRTANKTG